MSNLSHQPYIIYDLPKTKAVRSDDWKEINLGSIADVMGGGTPDTSTFSYWNPPTIPWVTPTDISACDGIMLLRTERGISEEGLRSSSATLLPPGTTLLTSRATVGECRVNTVELATNQGFASLVPREVDGLFLFYMAQHLKPVFCRLAAGTTYAEVSRREVRKVRCYLPKSEEEQKRIASLLLSADNTLDKFKVHLNAAQRMKTVMMQTLFINGIPGRHTAFQPINVFRRQTEIPQAWEASRLGANTTQIEYGTNAPSNGYKAGYPVIAIPQVVAPRLELGEVPYADLSEAEATALRLEDDDVLLIRTNGNPNYMGKSTLITPGVASQHVVFASYLIRVRTDKTRLLGSYLNYFLASPLGRQQALAMANTSAGNHNLGARSLKRFLLPRPNIKEQEEIVYILDCCEDALDSISKKIDALVRLKKSLLQNLLTGKVRVNMEAKL